MKFFFKVEPVGSCRFQVVISAFLHAYWALSEAVNMKFLPAQFPWIDVIVFKAIFSIQRFSIRDQIQKRSRRIFTQECVFEFDISYKKHWRIHFYNN